MVKLISAALAITMLFGAASLPTSGSQLTATVPITVGEQQAVWGKYKNKVIPQDTYSIKYSDYTDRPLVSNINTFGKIIGSSYTFDDKTGIYTLINPSSNIPTGSTRYYMVMPDRSERAGKTIRECTSQGGFNTDGSGYTVWDYAQFSTTKVTINVDTCGDFIGELTAVANTLPTNGKHTDGFWYIFKNIIQD